MGKVLDIIESEGVLESSPLQRSSRVKDLVSATLDQSGLTQEFNTSSQQEKQIMVDKIKGGLREKYEDFFTVELQPSTFIKGGETLKGAEADAAKEAEVSRQSKIQPTMGRVMDPNLFDDEEPWEYTPRSVRPLRGQEDEVAILKIQNQEYDHTTWSDDNLASVTEFAKAMVPSEYGRLKSFASQRVFESPEFQERFKGELLTIAKPFVDEGNEETAFGIASESGKRALIQGLIKMSPLRLTDNEGKPNLGVRFPVFGAGNSIADLPPIVQAGFPEITEGSRESGALIGLLGVSGGIGSLIRSTGRSLSAQIGRLSLVDAAPAVAFMEDTPGLSSTILKENFGVDNSLVLAGAEFMENMVLAGGFDALVGKLSKAKVSEVPDVLAKAGANDEQIKQASELFNIKDPDFVDPKTAPVQGDAIDIETRLVNDLNSGDNVRGNSKKVAEEMEEALVAKKESIDSDAVTFGESSEGGESGGVIPPGLKNIPKGSSVFGWMGRKAGELLTAKGRLPESVFQEKMKLTRKINAQQNEMKQNYVQLEKALRSRFGSSDKVPTNVMETLNAVLGNKILPEDFVRIPDDLMEPLAKMRKHIDGLSKAMIEEGTVAGELAGTFSENLGLYLTRSYRAFDDPNWSKKVPEEVKNRAKAFIRQELPDFTDAEVDGVIANLLVNDKDGPMGALASLGSKELSILKRRKEIPEPIRALWGEHKDPMINYGKSVVKMANLIENDRFLKNVRQIGLDEGFFSTKPTVENPTRVGEGGRAFSFVQKEVENMEGINEIITESRKRALDMRNPRNQATSPISNLFTSPEMKEIINTMDEMPRVTAGVFSNYLKTAGVINAGLTVGSPKTHIRNFMANPMIVAGQGHFNPKHLVDSIKLIREDLLPSGIEKVKERAKRTATRTENNLLTGESGTGKAQDLIGSSADDGLVASGSITKVSPGSSKEGLKDLPPRESDVVKSRINRLVELGVMHDTSSPGELKALMADAFSKDFSLDDIANSLMTKSKARRGLNGVFDLYQAEDDFWKVFAYHSELERSSKALTGKPLKQLDPKERAEIEEYAAEIIVKTMPTYSQVGRGVKKLRRTGVVGNFVSFPAEIMRTSFNTLEQGLKEVRSDNPAIKKIGATRLGSFASIAMAGSATAGFVGRAMTGTTQEEDNASRSFVPKWSKNSNLLWLEKPNDGKLNYIDLSYMDPYQYLKDPVIAAMRAVQTGEDLDKVVLESVGEFFAPFTDERILLSTMVDASRNMRSADNPTPIVRDGDSLGTKAEKYMGFFNDRLAPGVIKQPQRLKRAVTGDVDKRGKTLDLTTEVMSQLMGARIVNSKVSESLSFKIGGINRKMTDTQAMINDTLKGLGNNATKATPEAVRDTFEEANAAKFELYRQSRRLVQDAQINGMEDGQIIRILKDRGLSKQDIGIVITNKYIPIQPTVQMISKAMFGDAYEASQKEMQAVFTEFFGRPLEAE